MSDQSPPPKPKVGSLRDRIAAFEKSSTSSGPAPAPPAPRPKPAGFSSWKPKPVSPPSSPPPHTVNEEGTPAGGASAGMSAADAKESISKGGSLKDRMAALQGKSAFGGAPPVAPKPPVEKPRWKPPPVVQAPVDEDDQEVSEPTTSSSPKITQVPVPVNIAAAVERTLSPPTAQQTSNEAVSGEEGDTSAAAPDDEAPVDPEEEERQRRAAIAARMARLGGARVGMGPPVFGMKPPAKPPVSRKPTRDTEPTKVGEEPPKVGSPDLSKSPEQSSSLPAGLQSPSQVLSPPVSTSPEHVPEPDATISPPTEAPAIIVPATMPVPTVPRRAAPPRRKTPKAAVSEAQDTPVAPTAPEAVTPAVEGTDAPVTVEKEPPTESPKFEKEESTASTHVEKVELAPIVKEEETAMASEKSGAEVAPLPLAEKEVEEDERSSHDEAPPAIKQPATEIPVESTPPKADAPVTEMEQEDDEHSEYSEDDAPPTEKSTMQQIEQTLSKTVQPTSDPVEEEDEEARQQRVAEKLAKMGGVNPFGFPLQSLQKTPSEDLPSPPISPPQPTRSASVSRPLPERTPSLGSTTAFQLPPIPTSSLFDEPGTSNFSQDLLTSPRLDQLPAQIPRSQFEGATKTASDDEDSPPAYEEVSNAPFPERAKRPLPQPPQAPPAVVSPISSHRPPVQRYRDDDDSELDSRRSSPRPLFRQSDEHSLKSEQPVSSPPISHRQSLSSQTPRRIVPQTPELREEDSFTDEEADERLASSQLFVRPPEGRGVPVPVSPGTASFDEDEGGSENDSPLPVPHRRSLESPVRSKLAYDAEDDDLEETEESDHDGTALPVPPRQVRSLPQPPVSPPVTRQSVPQVVPPSNSGEILDDDEGDPIDPSFHSPSRRGSISSLRTHAIVQSQPPPTSGTGHLSPPSQYTQTPPPHAHLSSSPPPPQAVLPVREPEESEEETEDPEQARRRTIAERMAKLGGIKLGGAPPLSSSRPTGPPRRQTLSSDEQVEGTATSVPDVEAAPAQELTEEEEEQARKERIAAKLAGMGGLRIGMMPMGMGGIAASKPKSHILKEDSVDKQPSSQSSLARAVPPSSPPPPGPPLRAIPPSSPPLPTPPTRAIPPARAPPAPVYQEEASDVASEDGVQVEADESESEVVDYIDAEEPVEEVPPPLPSRSLRGPPQRKESMDRATASPPLPSGRPPVPVALPRRLSTRSTTSDPLPIPTPRREVAEYVMVDDPQSIEEEEEEPAPPPPPPVRPAAHRSPPSQARDPMTYPPQRPTMPESGDSISSQWELPSIPRGSLDFGSGTGDLSTSWTDAEESLPAVHQRQLRERQEASSASAASRASTEVTPGPGPRRQSLFTSVSSANSPPPSGEPLARRMTVTSQSGERKLSADELVAIWGRVGVQVCEEATTLHEKSKKQLIGDGTYPAFVCAVLDNVPNALQGSGEIGGWGYLVYAQNGSSVVKRASEIMPGDIVEMEDAKFKGHKGLQTYSQSVGTAGSVLVGVVGEFEVKKSKIRVFQANQHVGQQTVESVSYRLEDLKNGVVRVYRVLEA